MFNVSFFLRSRFSDENISAADKISQSYKSYHWTEPEVRIFRFRISAWTSCIRAIILTNSSNHGEEAL